MHRCDKWKCSVALEDELCHVFVSLFFLSSQHKQPSSQEQSWDYRRLNDKAVYFDSSLLHSLLPWTLPSGCQNRKKVLSGYEEKRQGLVISWVSLKKKKCHQLWTPVFVSHEYRSVSSLMDTNLLHLCEQTHSPDAATHTHCHSVYRVSQMNLSPQKKKKQP